MTRNHIAAVLLCLLALSAPGYSQKKLVKDKLGSTQLEVDVKFITVSQDNLDELGAALGNVVPGDSGAGQLDNTRDGLTDLATSPILSGQVGLVVKGGGEGSSPDAGKKPELQIAGVDKNGNIRFKPETGLEVDVWNGNPGGKDSNPRTPVELMSGGEQQRIAIGSTLAVDASRIAQDEQLGSLDAGVGSVEDVIEGVKQQLELQKALRSSYTEIIKTAKDNPTDATKEAAAQARKSIQTVIYQKAVFEAALNYATELSRVLESTNYEGALPDVSALPKDHALRKKAEVHQRAIETLRSWESKRKG